MFVVDSSVLILLAKSGLLDTFVDNVQGEVMIPSAVESGCLAVPVRPDGVLIERRIRERRIEVKKVQDLRTVRRLMRDFHLGPGEAEALALGIETGTDAVVTDDRNAVRACRLLRLSFMTAISILIRSRDKRLVPEGEALQILKKLGVYGRYSRSIMNDAMRRLRGKVYDGE